MLNKHKKALKTLKPLILITLLAFGFSTCGKRKPPVPPKERVAQIVEIDGKQVGDRVDIYWKMPARNASGGNTLAIARADVYRLAEKLDEPLSLTEEEFASRSTLIGSVPIEKDDFGLKQKSFSDKLQFAGQEVRLRYAIRFVNPAGQKAAFSNFFLIEPSANIAKSVLNLSSTVSQDAISLSWNPPATNLDGSTPVNILGYNVYRSNEKNLLIYDLLTKEPVKEAEFRDESFTFGREYRYFVRTVSLGRNAASVESYSSETVAVVPSDTFAPAPPEALTIASAPSTISIFFAFNLEKDVKGYQIYRSEDASPDKSSWTLLTKTPIEANTFQDQNLRPGRTYYYYVVAVDNFGNTSGPSEVVSETAL